MKLRRTLLLATGCAALAVWFSAAMTPIRRPPALSGATEPRPVEVTGAALANEIARLHERLRPDSTPRAESRNLFAFHRSPRVVAVVPPAAAAAAESPAPPVPASVLTLVGLAEDPAAGGDINGRVVRTAIISGRGQLFLVKEGETIRDGDAIDTVQRITADAVELMDPRDDRVRRLTLK